MYPNPKITHISSTTDLNEERTESYKFCSDQIAMNNVYPFSEIHPERQWRVHTCFEPCRVEGEVDPAITKDERPICGEEHNKNSEILCLAPETECEIYVKKSE